tara:strand:- start:3544 stop:4302 length:759 start_codon:yes stop_codon:yes gene_type:complete
MVSALIIPARMSSSRFPNKPMAKIKGIPMIGHCYLNSVSILGSKNTFVATCDKEIKEYIISIGGNVIMTSKDHNRATTRVSEALIKIEKKQKKKIHNILMHQGDEPLIKKNSIYKVIRELSKNNNNLNVVNLCRKTKNRNILYDVNNVKVMINKNSEAIYFSRVLLPTNLNLRKKYESGLIQTGIIGFKRNALIQFNKLKETRLEKYESVDMNRLIENNIRIKIISFDYDTISVDTKLDLKTANKMIKSFKL